MTFDTCKTALMLPEWRAKQEAIFFFHLERESEIKSRPACKSKVLVTYWSNQRKRKSAKNNTCSCGSSSVAEIILCQMAPKVSSSASAKGPNYRRGGYGDKKKDFKTLGISNGWGLHWGSGRVQNAITDEICHPNHQRLISLKKKEKKERKEGRGGK